MKKKTIVVITGIIMALVLAGCSAENFVTIGSFEKNTSTTAAMSYHKFNGEKSRSITVEEGKPIDVSVEIETEEGSLSISIKDEKGEAFYSGTDIPTSSFKVTLDKAGDYTITFKAKNHKGSYKVSWAESEKQ